MGVPDGVGVYLRLVGGVLRVGCGIMQLGIGGMLEIAVVEPVCQMITIDMRDEGMLDCRIEGFYDGIVECEDGMCSSVVLEDCGLFTLRYRDHASDVRSFRLYGI